MSQDIMSRELRSSHEFLLSNSTMVDIVRSTGDATVLNLYHDISQAVANFGFSEMHFRQSERTAVAFPAQSVAKEAGAAPSQPSPVAQRFNQKGSLILRESSLSVEALIVEARGVDTRATNLSRIQEFRNDLLTIISAGEMKAAEVGQIQYELDQAIGVLNKGGEITLLNSIKSKINALDSQRISVQRSVGAISGLAPWKVAAIAVFLGVAVFLLLRCLLKNKGCRIVEQIAAGMGKTILGLIRNLC